MVETTMLPVSLPMKTVARLVFMVLLMTTESCLGFSTTVPTTGMIQQRRTEQRTTTGSAIGLSAAPRDDNDNTDADALGNSASTNKASCNGWCHDRHDHQQQHGQQDELQRRRRQMLLSPMAFLSSLSLLSNSPKPSFAATEPSVVLPADSTTLPAGLLDARVTENVLSPPPYGMEGTDVFYPSWFGGSWNVYSECTSVSAPCGIALFGGNSTYQAAQRDIGPQAALKYESRFLTLADKSQTIADREFNVRSIAREAMGANSVVDVSLATPNKFSCLLLPKGSPTMLTVDLIVLNRRQETVDDLQFDCAEVVREIASPVGKSASSSPAMPSRAPILKEIETTSLYTAVPGPDGVVNKVKCRQRSAAFLLPSQQDPMALRMWEVSRGRPIDVRYYDVTYTKKT